MADPIVPAPDAAAPPVAAPAAPAAAPPAPAAPAAEPPKPPTPPAPAAEPPKAAAPERRENPYAAIAAAAAQAGAASGAQLAAVQSEAAAMRAELDAQKAAVAQFAASALAGLPSDAARAAVAEIASDPAGQLRAIAAMQKNGLVPGVVPAAVSTSQSPLVQPPPSAANDPDIAAARQHEAFEKQNAVLLANSYMTQNRALIERGRAKLAGKN